jgi:hypothetical protein
LKGDEQPVRQPIPCISVGDRIRLTCLPGRSRRGRGNKTRCARGKVVCANETFLTIQHEPAGWRECFLLEDIRSGRVMLLHESGQSQKASLPGGLSDGFDA